jgi:hypothetical protein
MARLGSKRGRGHERTRRRVATAITATLLILSSVFFVVERVERTAAAGPRPCLQRQELHPLRSLGACGRLYTETSPFNQPIPSSPQLLLETTRIVKRTVGFGPPPQFDGGVAGTRYDWGHPIYFSKRSDPLFTVHCTSAALWGPCKVEGDRIRIPSAAQPAGGSDGHLAVIDQRSGWEYDFWRVKQKPAGGGRLVVGYGGKTSTSGPGAYGLGSGATASGFGLAAGVIRPEELAADQINHALFMVVKCTNGTSVWPAGSNSGRSCSSIGLPNAGAPAMGQHFYLDMSDAQIAALPQPPWSKTILRAMAHYGLFVGDTGTTGWGIGIESGASYTSFGRPDPWALLGKRFGVPSRVGPPGKLRYYKFNLSGAVDWASSLKVVRTCIASPRCF